MNNGDCIHFCESMETFGAKCSCAIGYRLMQDGVNCEPEGSDIFLKAFLISIVILTLNSTECLMLLFFSRITS